MSLSEKPDSLAQYRAKRAAQKRKDVWIGLVVFIAALAALPLIRLIPDVSFQPGWFFGPGATFFLALGLADVRRQLATRNWTRTDCTIEFAIVERFRRGTTLPVVGFRYLWEGNAYLSTTLQPSMSGMRRSAAQTQIGRYPPGSVNHCYVNPAKPADAVLRNDLSAYAPGLFLTAAIVFLLVWLAMV